MISEIDPKHALGETFRAIAQTLMGRSEVRRQKKPAAGLSILSRLTKRA
jgi:Flp pilus assembly CpaE family ATPase